MAARTALTAGMAARFAIGMELLDALLDIRDELVMARKLTKHQRQYRKRKRDGQRDFRTVKKDGPWNGVRVTRRRLKVNVSHEAYERLAVLAEDAGLELWAMLTRMILKVCLIRQLLNEQQQPAPLRMASIQSPKSFKYKGTTGDKQLSYDITSTAANKLECHKKATGHSKARIVQTLILNYKPHRLTSLSRSGGSVRSNDWLMIQTLLFTKAERTTRSESRTGPGTQPASSFALEGSHHALSTRSQFRWINGTRRNGRSTMS